MRTLVSYLHFMSLQFDCVIADRVFDELDTTEVIHEELISPIIQSVMKGINGQYI